MTLYNFGLRLFLSKLESRWSEPFMLTKLFPFRLVEIGNIETKSRIVGKRQ